MFNLENLKIIITVMIAVLGWVIAHRLNSTRDRALKRRELITAHLINAYRILANDITHRDATPERDLKLETVISELQLFGSDYQIELTKKLANDVTQKDTFYVDDLLIDLRNSLRKELELSPLEGRITWLRYNKNKLDKDAKELALTGFNTIKITSKTSETENE
jgi:hypothetical protein